MSTLGVSPWHRILAYPADLASTEDLEDYPEAYEIDGECATVRALPMMFSSHKTWKDRNQVRTVAVPVVDWKPLDERLMYGHSLGERQQEQDQDARFDKTVQLEPGEEKTVFFMAWDFAYIPFRTLDGHEDKKISRRSNLVSNIVKLRRPSE